MLRFLAATASPRRILMACFLLALQVSTNGQLESSRTIVVGRVLDPDAAPAVGAVVVTSAGGQAVTGAYGTFGLEVELPADADSVRVTAVLGSGTASLVGSAQVGGLMRGGTTSAGTLVLAQAADCEPSWLPTFGQSPGVSDGGVTPGISALAVFDDGGGPALYAGGGFATAGGVTVNYVARWDGAFWSALDGGMDSEVYALAVFDDGGGPALYAGGAFGAAGGVTANRIARWNGTSWSALGGGMNQVVYALAVFDDGGGPALYAAGDFSTAGGVAVNRIARWNGSGWSALGAGVNERVWALAVYEDAHGPVLVAAGTFTSAGLAPANRIAKWNGTTWSRLGSGTDSSVRALAVFDDGGGPALFAGGHFLSAGGVAANRIARWDGASWSALDGGMDEAVFSLAVFDDGAGPALYAGGHFTAADGAPARRVAKWDGSDWSALGSGTNGDVRALAGFDAGEGAVLFAGGAFSMAGGLVISNAAIWDGSDWSTPGPGIDGPVYALAVFDDGAGPALYAGGGFDTAGSIAANGIARWDGSTWSALDGGVSGFFGLVRSLAVFDDGQGPALYAGGSFFSAGGETARNIARWDGTGWSALASGMEQTGGFTPYVHALAVFDDGGGPALYAGGGFTIAGGVPASRIAKWDGSSWSALGSGMAGIGSPEVQALTVFDDGGGPALYAGGVFSSAGGAPASRIARWDGSSWSALGAGMSGTGAPRVAALAVFDDGGGPALYAGGRFTGAGSVAANHVARWDGSSWSALGDGVAGPIQTAYVSALAVFDQGSGPALFAGGLITSAGGVPASRIARWDGSSWSALDSGVSDAVEALTVFDAGQGPSLFAGGVFGAAFDSDDSYLAQWGGCAGFPDPSWTDLGFGLPGSFFIPQLVGTGTLGPGTSGSLVLSSAAPERPAVLFVSAGSAPAPFKCGTLVPLPSLLLVPLTTNLLGGITLAWSSWPGGLSGLDLYFQYAIQDPIAICGVALSNALLADVP